MILIIEDEANIVQLDRLDLERKGFAVESAADGKTGLQAIENLHPTLVILGHHAAGDGRSAVCPVQ